MLPETLLVNICLTLVVEGEVVLVSCPGALRSSLRDREWRLSRAWRAQGLSVNKGGLLHLSKEVVTHTPWDVTGALRGEV